MTKSNKVEYKSAISAYESEKINDVVVYFLWFTLGSIGGHWFILGNISQAILRIALLGFVFFAALLGDATFFIISISLLSIIWIIDAFAIYEAIKIKNQEIMKRIELEFN